MTDTTIDSADFALVTPGSRRLRGLVLPYDETGLNASGEFVFSKGTVQIPDRLSLKLAHDGAGASEVLGHSVELHDTDKGIEAEFEIADSVVGNALLADYAKGMKKSLSAEFSNVVRDGKQVVSAALTGVATVVLGGFSSAAFFQAATPGISSEGQDAIRVSGDGAARLAAAVRELMAADPQAVAAAYAEAAGFKTPEDAESEDPETPINQEPETAPTQEENVAEAIVPNTASSASAPAVPEALTKEEAFSLLTAKFNGRATAAEKARLAENITSSDEVFALSAVKHSGTGAVQPYNTAPAWIGAIWDGNPTKPVISDLLGSKDLTNRTVAGFKFTTPPTGGTWAGNGAAITSTAIATTPYSYTATYWAGGNTFAREFVDFGVSDELFALYFDAQTQNFTQWLDTQALAGIVSGAQVITADNPAAFTSTIGVGMSALIDGATQVIANNAGVPTFALMKASLYKGLLKSGVNNALGYLNAALGFEEGTLSGFTIRPVPDATMGSASVIVGVRQGADVYTLPGSPVRAEALQVATGQIDVGLYGYGLVVPNKANAFVSVSAFS